MDSSIALITGANRGLGRSIALHLADAGTDVIGTYRTNEAESQNVLREIESRGRRGAMLQLDVGKIDTFGAFAASFADTLQQQFGRPTFDILINNAGVGGTSLIGDLTESQFDEMVNVHFKGPVFLTQRLLPRVADGGRILNISSGLTRMTFPGSSIYAANKGAIEVFTRYLAKEIGQRGITANVIAPGAIATDFNGAPIRDNAALNQQVASMTALGRVGLPDDVGAAVAAILSIGGRWINGQRIEVSGGQGL
jgi:NAD(P)-dependent dehydrogenase (short-subunit alcohol dehydrogenase family)